MSPSRAEAAYAADVKLEPYWWDGVPRPALPPAAMPERTEVAIVGSGYTGLSAALTLARAGRQVAVLEAGRPGEGASSRNGGAFGTGLRLSLAAMIAKYGEAQGVAFYKGAIASWDFLEDLVAREGIDCQMARTGRFTGAHARKDYDALGRALELERRLLGIEGEMIPRAAQHREVGTDHYHGGRLSRRGGNLHPALLHQGLLDRALAAGAQVIPFTRITGVEKDGAGFRVAAGGRRLQAREVVLATNGYTDPGFPWFKRRLVPVQSQIIATEPLPPKVVRQLIPNRRQIGDTCHLHHYYRLSPDGTRILFGGRSGGQEVGDPRRSGLHLHDRLVTLFPQLRGVRITHSWAGFLAYSFDWVPHMGVWNGLHYAVGYCGSGVAMATWLGHKLALRLLGSPEAANVFADRPFEGRPLYSGHPWFLPPLYLYYGLRDRLRI